jgi:hypothetical protein
MRQAFRKVALVDLLGENERAFYEALPDPVDWPSRIPITGKAPGWPWSGIPP